MTPENLYAFTDYDKIRNRIFEGIRAEVASQFPLKDENFILHVKDLHYGDADVEPSKEKEYILSNLTLARPLIGRLELYDAKTNKLISSVNKRLMNVPYLTNRGTFILRGVEYGFTNQQRLRPGVYVRITPTGEYEAFINSAVGPGQRIILDPETGTFHINVGQAKIQLLPILMKLGIKPEELQNVWGKEIYQKNTKRIDPAAAQKLSAFFKTQEENLAEALGKVTLDPKITSITLGKPITQLNPSVMLLITKKLLDVAQGKVPADDRDHLAFMRIVGPEDFLIDSVHRMRKELPLIFNRVRARRDVSRFPAWAYDKAVDKTFFGSGLASALQETNFLELFDNRVRSTRTGKGGIEDPSAISLNNRLLHPSHLNYIDMLLTPEGENVGVDVRFTKNTYRDEDGNIFAKFLDAKTGKPVFLNPQQVINKVITYPGEMESGRKYVRAVVNNQHVLVYPRQVDLIVPTSSEMFSFLSNLIPLKQNSYPQRVSMGARMLTQAVPLEHPEAPLVQNMNEETGRSYDEEVGEQLSVRSPVNGKVVRVDSHAIHIQSGNKKYRIPYYSEFPFNRKTFYNERPIVKAGDEVKAGQLLALSNHTDDKGILALGRNLKTGYFAWEGLNYEDAAVISESGAKKLSSEHLYQKQFDLGKDITLDKTKYFSIFPNKFESKEELDNYFDNGVIKPGTIVRKGTPLVLAFAKTHQAGLTRFYKDASVEWEQDDPGVVVNSVIGNKFINVLVKTYHPLRVGDKISGRYGDKSIISAIIPDDQMAKDESGEPLELILNPLGLHGRQNISQLWELLLSKVAHKTGQPYVIEDFKENMLDFVKRELEKNNLKDKEKIYIEKYNTKILAPTGYRYILKLHHFAESKLGGRGLGQYSSEETPVTGTEGGAKRVGLLEMLGILGHGAYDVAKDARVVRGQKNEDFWTRVSLGYEPSKTIDTPMVYNKFLAQLIGMGLYPYDRNDKIHVFALTKKDIKNLVRENYLKNAEGIKLEGGELKAVPGGLFDGNLTGGFGGVFWSGIKLPMELPNPLVEPMIRNLLDLTENDFLKILTGAENYKEFGTGPEALKKALQTINIDKELEKSEGLLNSVKGNALDKLVKKIKFLRALQKNKINPDELFWDTVPVLPPAYRPASVLQSELPIVSDINFLYKDLFDLAETYKELKRRGFDDPNDVLLLYNSLKAVTGLGDPINPKYRAQKISGILRHVIGASPKEGVVQRKLLGAQVNLVGRATIIPNPNLDLDEVGIPISSAWEVYKPYVVRRLVRDGMEKTKAVEEVLNKTPIAERALREEIKERPVIITRAPVLHKYGTMAAWPRLTNGNTIELHPFVTSGFGADFDGDAMNFHVPADPKAIRDALKMLPSQNLISFREFKAHYLPTMEFLAGLYYLSSLKGRGEPKVFKNLDEVLMALKEGKITPDQRVIILNK